MPRAWSPSSDHRAWALSACSTGPPTGSCGACRATGNRRTTRCAMAGSDGASAATGQWLIERLQPSDAEHLCPLSMEAGWNQVAADWRLMLTLGRGYGVRGRDSNWIASALALPLGPVCWLSMVLVTQPIRGQGLGTRLLTRLIAEVEASGAAAGLDATELGRPIYLPLGFRDVYSLSRWHAPLAVREALPPPPGIAIGPATADDLERICAYD